MVANKINTRRNGFLAIVIMLLEYVNQKIYLNSLPFYIYVLQGKIVSHFYHIGHETGLQLSIRIIHSHSFCRIQRPHAQRFVQGYTDFFNTIPHGFHHGEVRARKGAVWQYIFVAIQPVLVMSLEAFGYGVRNQE